MISRCESDPKVGEMTEKPFSVESWSYGLGRKFTGCLKDKDGDVAHIKDGKFHREDGPALLMSSGSRYWHRNGKRHREDGPAFICFDGMKEWYLNGEEYTEQEHRHLVRQMKMKLLDKIPE